MSNNGKASWKDSYISKAVNLVMYQIFKDGIQFISGNIKDIARVTNLTTSTIYNWLRNGRASVNCDCPTIDKIFAAFDPVLQQEFRAHPENKWSQMHSLAPKPELMMPISSVKKMLTNLGIDPSKVL